MIYLSYLNPKVLPLNCCSLSSCGEKLLFFLGLLCFEMSKEVSLKSGTNQFIFHEIYNESLLSNIIYKAVTLLSLQ